MADAIQDESLRMMRRSLSVRTPQSGIIPPSTAAIVPFYQTDQYKTTFEDYNPYEFEMHKHWWIYDEPAWYPDYTRIARSNPWAYMLSEYLTNELFANDFHSEGPSGAVKTVDQFFEDDDTKHKLRVMVRQTVELGNGGGDVVMRGGKILGTRVLDFASIRASLEDGVTKYTQDTDYIADKSFLAEPDMKAVPLRAENILHFRLKEWPNTPYGMSLFRPNLLLLMALDQSGQDIPAALKRIAYAPLLAKLDLEGYDNEKEKLATQTAYAEKLKNLRSSTTNLVTDKRHDIGIIGSLGGGGGGAQMLPVMDLLSPIISVVLINFGMALGYFLQQGANRSILEEQKEMQRHMIYGFRRRIAHDLKRQLVSKLTDRKVEIVFDLDPVDWERKANSMMRLYERGLVSKEFVVDSLDITDTGANFLDPAIVAKTPKLGLPTTNRAAGGA